MQPETAIAPKQKRLKLTEILILVITIIIIGLLVHLLIGYLSLKHEVNSAQATTDRVLRDIRTQNASDAYPLGDASFKAKNSKAQLQSIFKAAAPNVIGTSVVVHQTVANSSKRNDVSIIYKFAGKHPYYLRVIVRQPHGGTNWQLINLASDTAENPLL